MILYPDFQDFAANLMEVDNIQVKVISLEYLLIAKKAANRAKDINDIENLTQ